MQKRKDDLKFEELIRFSMPKKMFYGAKIKVKEDGEVYISTAIVESVKKNSENMWVDFRHSEDYKTIAIKTGGGGDFKFPKAGVIKFKEWKEILQKFGYAVPAVYSMEWKQEENMWIGRPQEVAEAPISKRRCS